MNQKDEMNQDQQSLVQMTDLDDVDRLLVSAEKMSRNLEKLKKYALTLTKPKDWCLFGETLHMTVQAAEDVAAKVGISWPSVDGNGSDLIKKEKITIANGHYAYIYTAEFWWFGRRITAQGKAASNKPFFSTRGGQALPADEVDEPNVMQSAYSNLIINGVRRVTGLHNVDLEDLKGHINTDLIPRVNFKEEFKQAPLDQGGKDQLTNLNLLLSRLVGDEVAKKQDWLQKETSFTVKSGKDKGKTIPGKKSLKDLTPKQIPFVYRSCKAQFTKETETLAESVYPNKEAREKALIKATTITVEESGEIIAGVSDLKSMSVDVLCKCYDTLLGAQLDQKASTE